MMHRGDGRKRQWRRDPLAGADGALDVGLAVLLLHDGVGQAHQLGVVAAGRAIFAGGRLLAALALAQVQPGRGTATW